MVLKYYAVSGDTIAQEFIDTLTVPNNSATVTSDFRKTTLKVSSENR
jgi:hypothetical protein